MHTLFNKTTGQPIGEINEQQFQFLVDQLEEESLEDRDYAITSMVLDYFEGQGADPDLLAMLRSALGDRDEILIEWR